MRSIYSGQAAGRPSQLSPFTSQLTTDNRQLPTNNYNIYATMPFVVNSYYCTNDTCFEADTYFSSCFIFHDCHAGADHPAARSSMRHQ